MKSPASFAVPPARASPAPRASDRPIPDWVRALLPELEITSARNVTDLVDAPTIVITRRRIVVEGRTVAAVAEYAAKKRLARVDAVFEAMKRIREQYKASHPDSSFPGVVMIWVDRRVPLVVVKDVFQTAAFAGFPNASFVVRDRNARGRFARLDADALVPRPGATTARIPPEVIQRIVRQHYKAFRFCYEKALAKNPDAKGRVVVRFEIGPDGRVSSATDDGSQFPDPDVLPCILAGYRKLVFPKPDGGKVTVIYPIEFSPSP